MSAELSVHQAQAEVVALLPEQTRLTSIQPKSWVESASVSLLPSMQVDPKWCITTY